MVNIAFKRAKNTTLKGYFHDEHIVEYRPDPDNAYAASKEWEILSEEDFNRELSKNPELHVIFCENKKKMADSLGLSKRMAEVNKLQLTKEERLELIKLRKFKKYHLKKKR